MKRRNAWLMVLLLGLPAALLAAAPADAPEADAAPDVRVLVDVSGSMKQNDPRNLRRPALELLAQLFPEGSRGGVWTFGHTVKVLAPHGEADIAWRRDALRKASQIGSNERFTDIPAALAAASDDLEKAEPAHQRSIILLTDGKVDISKSGIENVAARRKVLETQLPALRAAGIKVHTIALSADADRELMERLAVDTGGQFAIAHTPEELNRVFLKVFDAAAPAEQLPLAGNRFSVDDAIDELTVLVLHSGQKPVQLRSPTKVFTAASSAVRWFAGKGYDLITVADPDAGEWQIDGDLQDGSRVTIVSDLSLAASRLLANQFVRQQAEVKEAAVAALKEQDELLQRPELLALVSFSATVQRGEDGRKWEATLQASDDGWYRAPLPMLAEAGTYEVAITADGKTFQRSQRQTVTVRDAFDIQSRREHETPLHIVTLFARNPEIDGVASRVSAIVKAPDGSEREQPLSSGDGRAWPLEIVPPAAGGRFEIAFKVDGRYRSGESFQYRSGTITVDAEGHLDVAAAPPPVPAAAEAESPPADEAAVAPVSGEAAAEHGAEPEAESPAWKRWALYGGIALGNLLLIGLGFFAFRMIMGGGKSKSSVLDEPDEEGDGSTAPAGKQGGKAPAEKPQQAKAPITSIDDLDLPVDAIDIDPAADKKN